MSSKAGQSPQTSEAPGQKPRLHALDAPQLAGRHEGERWQVLQRSIGNHAVASLLQSNPAEGPIHPSVLAVLKSSGHPLEASLRKEMEGRFHEDFSDVRVHADAAAAHAARSVNATAFTVGNDVVFDHSQFSHRRESGKRLLAHELAHVVQQRRGGSAPAGSPPTERAAERAAHAPAHAVPHPGGSRVGIARQGGPEIAAPKMEEVSIPGGGTEMRVDGVTVVTIGPPPKGTLLQTSFAWRSKTPKTVVVQVDRNFGTLVSINEAGLKTLGTRGFSLGIRVNTEERPYLGERPSLEVRPSIEDRPSLEELPLRILDVPPLPPPLRRPQPKPKPKPATPKAAPKKKEEKPPDAQASPPSQTDLAPPPPVQEKTPPPSPPPAAPITDVPPQSLPDKRPPASNVDVQPPLQSLPPTSPEVSGLSSAEQQAPAVDPQIKAKQELILGELADVESVVAKLQDDLSNNPKDVALNVVRGTAVRLQRDQQFVEEFEKSKGSLPPDARAAVDRIKELRKIMDENVIKAEKWHTDNPAGESLGMMHERWGTSLAGYYDKETDKKGIHYISGGAAITGALVVAFVDAAEKLISFGFHDTATAVAQAYARGDISWNEGGELLDSAAARAILIALATRGLGAATSRLGGAAAEGVGLVPRTIPYGLVSGGVEGGITAAGGLVTQTVITKAMEDNFNSPAARAIWAQGMPQGKDWAIAIPLGIFLGVLGGGRQVEISNEKLVGSVLNTSEGQLRVQNVTKDGRIIVRPVSGTGEVPAPPTSDITLTYDPVSKSWKAPKPPAINVPDPKPPTSTSGESASLSKDPADVDVKPPAADVDAKPPAASAAQIPAKPQFRSIEGGRQFTPARQGHLTDVSNESGVELGEQAEFEQAANQDVEQPLQKAVGDPATENFQPSMQRQGTSPQASAGGKGGRSSPVKPVRSSTAQKAQASAPTRTGTARPPTLRSVAPLNTVPEPYPNLPRGLDNYTNSEILDFYRANKGQYPPEIQSMIDDIPPGMKKTPMRERLETVDRAIRDLHTQDANRLAGRANAPEDERPFINSVRGTSNEGGKFSSAATDNKQLTLVGRLKGGGTAEFDSVEFQGSRIVETKMNMNRKTLTDVVDQMKRQADFARDWGFSEIRWEVWDYDGLLMAQEAQEQLGSVHPDLAARIRVVNPEASH